MTTLILLAVGTLLTFLLEYHNPDTIGHLSFGEKWMASAFQSVTTRTAGYSTFSQAGMHEETRFLNILLMFIGGSPGGTAGGVKTTTIAMLTLTCIAFCSRWTGYGMFWKKNIRAKCQNGICDSRACADLLLDWNNIDCSI